MTSAATQARVATPTERLGLGAKRIAVIAAVGSFIASIFVGVLLGPLEVKSATGLSEVEQGLLIVCFAAMASQVIWLGLGLWALIQGIVAVTGHQGRRHGWWAIWLAVGAPIISFGIFVGLTLLVSPIS